MLGCLQVCAKRTSVEPGFPRQNQLIMAVYFGPSLFIFDAGINNPQ
jgi:hypothetical protein